MGFLLKICWTQRDKSDNRGICPCPFYSMYAIIKQKTEEITMQVTIDALESYLDRQYGRFGNDHGLFMKLVEEIGEVAEILNKRTGRKANDNSDLKEELGNELADVIHYAVAIAAVNGLNLNDTILDKDKRASVKYHHDMNLETFISEIYVKE